jgi:hypothetical protein
MQVEPLEDRCLMATPPVADVFADSRRRLAAFTHRWSSPPGQPRPVVVGSGATSGGVGTVVAFFTTDGGKNWDSFGPTAGSAPSA